MCEVKPADFEDMSAALRYDPDATAILQENLDNIDSAPLDDIEWLLRIRADPNTCSQTSGVQLLGSICLCYQNLTPGAPNGDDILRLFRDLLARTDIAVNIPDKKGHLPIHYAAQMKDPRFLHSLLTQSSTARLNVDKVGFGRTALHLACSSEAPIQSIKYLLEAGANPNAHSVLRKYVPFQFALYSYSHTRDSERLEDALRELLEYGADPNAQNSLNETLLHAAIYAGCSSHVCMTLIQHRANLNAVDASDNTPMQTAVAVGNNGAIFAIQRWYKEYGYGKNARAG